MMPEPKKHGALLALLSGDHGEPDEDDSADGYEEEDNMGASYDAATESLARQLNVPEGHRDEFKTTLKEAIHACVRGYEPEGS
jgi:hypothetical protein